jgi:hypothetical protein
MLQRNLLYTGITRGKRLVVLVGSRPALLGAGPALARRLEIRPNGDQLLPGSVSVGQLAPSALPGMGPCI